MPQSMPNTPSAAPTSFAGLLAALAEPVPKPEPAWSDEDLADDVATLSYEQALNAHSRYHPDGVAQGDAPEGSLPAPPLEPMLEYRAPASAPAMMAAPEAVDDSDAHRLERELKVASVTIRLSQQEAAQLHKRATQAGMTVSAYLRSCTFEVETLRAMVKETMAQLKAATDAQEQMQQEQQIQSQPEKPGLWTRMMRFLFWSRQQERVARA